VDELDDVVDGAAPLDVLVALALLELDAPVDARGSVSPTSSRLWLSSRSISVSRSRSRSSCSRPPPSRRSTSAHGLAAREHG
jgi:hypothetical protein